MGILSKLVNRLLLPAVTVEEYRELQSRYAEACNTNQLLRDQIHALEFQISEQEYQLEVQVREVNELERQIKLLRFGLTEPG